MRQTPNDRNPPWQPALVRWGWRTALCAVGLLVCPSTVLASDPPPATQPATGAKTTPKAAKPQQKRGAPKRRQARPRQRGGCGDTSPAQAPAVDQPTDSADQGPGPSTTSQPAKDNKTPVWACSQQSIELEPVWAGEPISCTFTVRNEGTAELKIRTKGG